jgi:hypothetical protein
MSPRSADSLDTMELERWPIACVLMWIRAVNRNWSTQSVLENMRRAQQMGARAFADSDFPFEECQVLVESASRNTLDFIIFHNEGKVEIWQLGPDARLLPTKDASGRETFGLFPKPPVDLSEKLVGLWCHRRQVRSTWPHPSIDGAVEQREQDREGNPAVGDVVERKGRRGRRLGYPWDDARSAVIEKLDYEGAPGPDSNNPKLRTQADVERFIADFMLQALEPDAKQPNPSRVRYYTSLWLRDWSADRLR